MKSKETKLKMNIVKNILNGLGFKLFNKDVQIEKNNFEIKMNKLIETNQIFNKDKSKLRTLFTTFNFKSVKSIRDFMLFVNNILKNYGLKITSQSKKNKI